MLQSTETSHWYTADAAAAAAVCADKCTPGYFASGAEAHPKAAFNWAGCAGVDVGLAAFGERCGAAQDKFM